MLRTFSDTLSTTETSERNHFIFSFGVLCGYFAHWLLHLDYNRALATALVLDQTGTPVPQLTRTMAPACPYFADVQPAPYLNWYAPHPPAESANSSRLTRLHVSRAAD